MTAAALIVAAGRGTRVAGPTPKQYRRLAGRFVLSRTLEAFLRHPDIDVVQTVTHADDSEAFEAVRSELDPGFRSKLQPPVSGRAMRQQSVLEGLLALARTSPAPNLVLIHDGARPFVDVRRPLLQVDSPPAPKLSVPGTPAWRGDTTSGSSVV